ncbi:unnamed protein product [Blepharisma stoltei]|uniref:Uncharacterized protein n=1 Tax=Blepharisma stoltei TaxID=1481888 RepID=A0AAU9JU95_9CILI|nr:unnamed protein product [Blepharisma stoltei]
MEIIKATIHTKFKCFLCSYCFQHEIASSLLLWRIEERWIYNLQFMKKRWTTLKRYQHFKIKKSIVTLQLIGYSISICCWKVMVFNS